MTSRIGAVRGDVLAIEVLESGGGRVIDEIVVNLPSDDLLDLMVNEVHAIDGVSVEDVRPVEGVYSDGGLMALVVAAELAEAERPKRLSTLIEGVVRLTEAEWAMVVHEDAVVESRGEVPTPDWITSLLAGSRHLGDPHAASGDMFWADLPGTNLWVAAGRSNRPVHDRERVRLDLFVRIADSLLT